MSALAKALSELQFRIPKPILDAVFIRTNARWRQTPSSLDEIIMNQVIRPRVLIDCNLVGGTEAFVSLEGLAYERDNDYTFVYRIPKSRTQGRSINSVLNITFSDPTRMSGFGANATQGNTAMLAAGAAVMDAMGAIPITSTAKVQLIGENVVMVKDTISLPPNIYLRCILANDENMSHIQMRSYRAFAKLVELAVKAYIFNNYAITMDMGELVGGQTLGRFKEIVDTYSEAEELYQVYLDEKFTKISLMNDMESHTRLLKLMIGGSR